MRPEDRLDALLSMRTATVLGPQGPGDDSLVPLLAAASRLEQLRVVEPPSDFVSALEARLLVRAAALAAAPAPTSAPLTTPRPLSATPLPGQSRRQPRVFWSAVAAALVLVVGAGTLTAAAAAGPGSPLYALHRWEQSVRAQLAASSADRVRLHMANAREALAALDSAVARHAGDPVYSDALATLRAEDAAAADALRDVPAGADHDVLAAQLDALHVDERRDLRAALAVLGWTDRLATTRALGDLGESVPQVTATQAAPAADGHGHDWLVTITGSGFQPGTVLVVDGKAVGQVVDVVPTRLTIALSTGELQRVAHGAGVENPDGTAAALTQIAISSQPVATPTPAGGHGNGGDGGNGSGHGKGQAPTPTPTGG